MNYNTAFIPSQQKITTDSEFSLLVHLKSRVRFTRLRVVSLTL